MRRPLAKEAKISGAGRTLGVLICIFNVYYKSWPPVNHRPAGRERNAGGPSARGATMHLTLFTGCALRSALCLACHPDRLVSVDEVGRAYGISRHHLVKVVQTLVDLGV